MPAQILLSDRDREAQRELQARLMRLGYRGAGPTLIYRAGQRALLNLTDGCLSKTIDTADEKPTMEILLKQFHDWCTEISQAVEATEPTLEYTHEGDRGGTPGIFSYRGRFVSTSLMQDGRVLVSGLAANMAPLEPGTAIPRAPQLFPGGLARMVSLNADGAALTKLVIIAWLRQRDDQLEEIRAAFRRHSAATLRKSLTRSACPFYRRPQHFNVDTAFVHIFLRSSPNVTIC